MPNGTIDEPSKHAHLYAFLLVGVIVVCAIALVSIDKLSTPWTVALQVISAVAGAGLGTVLRADRAAAVVRNQARPAIRRLFDQATRLGNLVSRVEAHQTTARELSQAGTPLDTARLSDWLTIISENLRGEIDATATAIDDWGDLSPDVRQAEIDNYRTRNQRMPQGNAGLETEA